MLKYFSPFGRAKRLEYWCFVVFSFLANEVYRSVESLYVPRLLAGNWQEQNLFFVLFTISGPIVIFAARLRCEDIGISAIFSLFVLFDRLGIIMIIALGIPRTDFARDPRVLKKIDALNDRIDGWEEKIKSLWLFLKKYCKKVMKKNDNIKKKR